MPEPLAGVVERRQRVGRQVDDVLRAATIDQSAVDGWQPLGTFTFAAGGGQFIHLGDATGEANDPQLVFDAIRLVPVDDGGSGEPPTMDASDGGGCSARLVARGAAPVPVATTLTAR